MVYQTESKFRGGQVTKKGRGMRSAIVKEICVHRRPGEGKTSMGEIRGWG